jgi:hypothetical protein
MGSPYFPSSSWENFLSVRSKYKEMVYFECPFKQHTMRFIISVSTLALLVTALPATEPPKEPTNKFLNALQEAKDTFDNAKVKFDNVRNLL